MTAIWLHPVTPEILNFTNQNTMASHLGIEFTQVSPNSLSARMPVDERTIQPFGLLHGGASVALAETLGSVAASLTIDLATKAPVGMEINANHLRPVNSGWVIGKVEPIHLGKTTQVWEIRIDNEAGKLVCIARITLAIVNRQAVE